MAEQTINFQDQKVAFEVNYNTQLGETFPMYFQNYMGEIEGTDPKLENYSKVIEQIRFRSHERLDNYNQNFNREYVTDTPENIIKSFALNGALKINPNNLANFDSLITQENSLFKIYRNSIHTRSNSFYEYELSPSQGIETEYFTNLVNKLNFIYNFFSKYQSQISNLENITFPQWQILNGLLDNYNLYVSKLFNTISYLSTIRKVELGIELEYTKEYYQDLTSQLYQLHNGHKIGIIQPVKLDFDKVLKHLDSKIIKPVDKEILRGVPESNSTLFNNIWADALANEILVENPDKNQEIFIIGLHYGVIQLPYILNDKLLQLGYSNTKIISSHYSSKNEYKDEEFLGLFDSGISQTKSKKVILVDDGIVTGKGIYLVANYLESQIGANVKVSVEYLIRQDGEAYKYGITDSDFLATIDSISRVSPFSRIRSQEQKQAKRKTGELRLIDRFANRMLSKE